ncbi:uncharacterized protein LOC129318144 [Prosopis cineraria]|uniref:uncharacterized protein LOC129318144 n=1 Tax=Prosopis cineraria TaxID=364024 RepID=UPI00240FF9A1|nr:uncharacterized protein LOC129318144 [Prosopis cineraria]XP_054818723.1 uncharacterized protein LOC129318144 [Prosopis cineraria]XP_054818724.1 uncharacterized protein LOC129318144 [Prosopis cineraria]XP_054818725.1 uncharacterized protein LOC129318144 [Prosopis cineraria]XP_054818726.1 uncharacterized protein LOC129318144 [Prosopis cineraria]
MTLEDFFTLTEMRDGLTAPSRVQELVSVMQEERDCVVKNVGDAMRQWAAVASTIAATDNKDCLDLFIQSDGLWFINRWLQDAQNVGDTNESFIEESINALLRAVEKLHLDCEKSMSSGIWDTVKNLLGHRSSRVQEVAKVLFDSWKVGGNGEDDSHDMKLVRVDNEGDKIVREEVLLSAQNEANNENNCTSGLVADAKSPLRSTSTLQPERNASVQMQSSSSQLHSSGSLDGENIKERSPDCLATVSTSKEETAPTKEESPSCTVSETLSVGSHSFPHPKQGNFEGKSDVKNLNDSCKMEKQEQIANGPLEKPGVAEVSLGSTKPEPGPNHTDASEAKAPEFSNEPVLPHNVGKNDDIVCHNATAAGSLKMHASDRKSVVDDTKALKSSSPQLPKTAENNDGCSTNVLHESSVSAANLGKPEVFDISFSRTECASVVKEDSGHVSNEGKETSNGSEPIKPRKHRKSPNMIDRKSSDIELDYGIVDALEVARQVAQEVEREVCSSSEKISEGGTGQPHSPDSVGKEDTPACVEPREVPSRQSYSAEVGPKEERHANISDDVEAETACIPDVESSHVSEAALDPGGNSEKNLCFDLNEEFGSDDVDNPTNLMSTLISFVSASKPAATPGLPMAPLQFEGTLGRIGSAATSAFRPASPRKNSDSEKNTSISGNSDISKQRQDFLDIDLNVAESEDGLGKQIAESSGLPSGQSSAELSPVRSRRLELDLNSVGDDVDAQPSDQRMEGQLLCSRNGHWSPSPASSTSSMQPSVRNIDLNDRPYLQTDLVDQGPSSKSSHITNACGFPKVDAPVISLLGTKVEVGRRETRPSPNGKATESAMDLTMSRDGVLGTGPTVSYSHSPTFAYNGLTTVSPLSFSSAMYGSGGTVPYMVDSRGAPVVPQVVGSSPAILSSYSQPPFMVNLTGAQLGLNGVGPSRPNFDLNTGFMIEGGNREALAARQFFFPGQNRAIEEQVRNIHQPSSSGAGGKRKEPDSGWEAYPFSYKHPQPPWK